MFTPAGLPAFNVYSTGDGVAAPVSGVPVVALTVDLKDGAVGFSTTKGATTATIQAKLSKAKAAEEALLAKTFGTDRMGQGQAVKASAMWTLVSTPAENAGAPLLPVSRVLSPQCNLSSMARSI